MPLYPSLEDMKMDKILKSEIPLPIAPSNLDDTPQSLYPFLASPYINNANSSGLYPNLNEYMGIDLTSSEFKYNDIIATQNDLCLKSTLTDDQMMVAPISGMSAGLRRGHVNNGVRELVLCKNEKNKIGLKLKSINNGIFIVLVVADSPAALAGLRFGDQILQLNDENVAGFSQEKINKLLQKCSANNIKIVIRDRPFERSITLLKDTKGEAGFVVKKGKITHLIKDSSAARNGLLIDHQILEVNGQNMVGLSDAQIKAAIQLSDLSVTLTIMPSVIYENMIKNLAFGMIKKLMDHNIYDI